jgi:hypothetical protein
VVAGRTAFTGYPIGQREIEMDISAGRHGASVTPNVFRSRSPIKSQARKQIAKPRLPSQSSEPRVRLG